MYDLRLNINDIPLNVFGVIRQVISVSLHDNKIIIPIRTNNLWRNDMINCVAFTTSNPCKGY